MRGDNFKDISHYVLIQLAKFYEVSVDYLQGVQANKHERLFIFFKNAFFNLFYIFITITCRKAAHIEQGGALHIEWPSGHISSEA